MPIVEGPDRAPSAPLANGSSDLGAVPVASIAGATGPAELMRDTSWPASPDVVRAWPELAPAAPRSIRHRMRRALRLATTTAQFTCLALVAYAFLFNFSVVRGSSMAPRIHDGDRIFIDHLTYLFHGVERGDIVVLKYPLDPSVDYIKRVVGLPGDEIEISRGEVWVNGVKLDEPYVEAPDPLTRLYARVQPAHYFVLGDNRRRSSDSREFGQVPRDYVRGKVQLRLWPPTRVGSIDE